MTIFSLTYRIYYNIYKTEVQALMKHLSEYDTMDHWLHFKNHQLIHLFCKYMFPQMLFPQK